MKVTFLGAAREVTGSRYLLSFGSKNVLIDCGMEQGKDTYVNQRLPLSPAAIDAVVLTHAHIDHSGMLPKLYKEGFRGPIFATPATIALSDIMLRDCAHIQEQEAEWQSRKAQRAGLPLSQPLYTQEDAMGAVQLMRPASYTEETQVTEGMTLRMTDAGHLLGSASATLTVSENNVTQKIVFSGDIGNLHQPILNDPSYLRQADVVIMESTYGDRLHGERPDYIQDLADTLQTTFDRGGNVVIPSFAVGRTQELLYFLRQIKEQHFVHGHDGFPVYMDSPLAIAATEIFTEADSRFFDEEMNALLRQGINPLRFDDLKLCVTSDESKLINEEKRPSVIISASGMCEAGRIRHHLKHNLWRENATILFVGYQSVGTLGRALMDGAKTVRLFGEEIAVHAQIRALKAMSGHADQNGLLTWANSFSPAPQRFYITHGEESASLTFADLLKERGLSVRVPYNGDAWDLLTGECLFAGPRTLVEKIESKSGTNKKKGKKKSAHERPDADQMLAKAMANLQRLVNSTAPYANGIKRQLAEQINKLIRKWE